MIQNISVIGAGTMGHGIALVFAMHGYPVSLYDAFPIVRDAALGKIQQDLEFLVREEFLEEQRVEETLRNVTIFSDLPRAVACADYVIEAISENMQLKQNLFLQLDGMCPKHAILASNTSSLGFAEMIKLLPEERRARAMVCHWYNPAHLIPIAELSCYGNMSQALFGEVYNLYTRCEKKPIKILKDVPGLICNRILHAQAREVFSLMESGVGSAEDIDRALKYGPGFRSATTGMLEVADMGGLDVWCATEDNLFPVLSNAARASDKMRELTAQNKLGIKTGEGYFSYPQEIRDQVLENFYRRLLTQLRASQTY